MLPPDQSNTATMTVVQTFSAADSAKVVQRIPGETATFLKITGIRAGTLLNEPIN